MGYPPPVELVYTPLGFPTPGPRVLEAMERWQWVPPTYAPSPDVTYVPETYYLEVFGMGAELLVRHHELAMYVACVAGFKKDRLAYLEPIVRLRKQVALTFAAFPCEVECLAYNYPGHAPALEEFEELYFLTCREDDPTAKSRWRTAMVHLASLTLSNVVDQHKEVGCDRVYAAQNSLVMGLSQLYGTQLAGSNCYVAWAGDPTSWMSGAETEAMCPIEWRHDCGGLA